MPTPTVSASIQRIRSSTVLLDPSQLVRPKEIRSSRTHIFNACLRLAYFPSCWKHAIVIAIPKPNKDITDPGNYRPISLLSSVGKLLERIILRRINQHLDTARNIIPHEQFGFKRGHSTNHQLARLVRTVKDRFAAKKSSGMIMLDVEKAYDSVWQEAILHKMLAASFGMPLLKILLSFLKHRSFQVHVNGSLSENKRIPFGVPQGSVLSPVLYNIFVSDVVMVNDGEYYLFADDTGFVASDENPSEVICKLQHAQDSLESYYQRWKIKVNPLKTQAIFFTWKRSNRNLPQRQVVVGGHAVPWSDEVKYLGITLDPKLTFGKHITRSLEKICKLTKSLYCLVNRRSRLHMDKKLLLYKTVFHPTLTYGFPVVFNCARSHRLKLQTKQNKLLKMILNLSPFHPTEDVHQLANVELIDEWVSNLMPRFWNSCRAINNPLLETLVA